MKKFNSTDNKFITYVSEEILLTIIKSYNLNECTKTKYVVCSIFKKKFHNSLNITEN